MKNIFIFDMDGTLTPSRREMTKDFEVFYSNWAENHTFFLVSGSNLEKIKEQVPEYILNLSEGVFTCGGNQLWLNGELSYNHEFKPENNLNFSTGKRKHFPFDEESKISSFRVQSLTPINSSFSSSLIDTFPESLNSLFPLFATSINLFFLTIPFLVAKTT